MPAIDLTLLATRESDLSRFHATSAAIGLVADQFDLNPTWAWRPRLLALAGELLLRVAIQIANAPPGKGSTSTSGTDSDRSFDQAAEEATRLFITAQAGTSDSDIQATARRGLALIEHLAMQQATSDKAGRPPDA